MSTSAVRSAAETQVATVMSGFQELPFQNDIEMNDVRLLDGGYAVWPGTASQSFLIHQGINLEMPIRVSISKRVFVRNDDDKITEALSTLYGFSDELVRRFVRDRLEIPEIVQFASLTEMSDPQFIGEGRDVVSLNLEFLVRYII